MTVDYVIVGLGIGSAHVIRQLEQRGRSYVVFDDPSRSAASFAAAGLINPITGRNYAKSWMIDELLLHIKSGYEWFHKELGGTYIEPLRILRVLNSIAEENKWASRLGEDGYQSFLSSDLVHLDDARFKQDWSLIEVRGAHRVKLVKLLGDLRAHLIHTNRLKEQSLSLSDVDWSSKKVEDFHFGHIISCQGAFIDPEYKSYVPVVSNLGEVLEIVLPGPMVDFAIKKKAFLVPFRDRYWVGGTYSNLSSGEDIVPDYGRLHDWLKDMLNTDYKTMNEYYGLRPTVADRRPIVGRHPEISSLSFLNGLGTKGCSLAPYCSDKLIRHLEDGEDLDEAISVGRFLS